MEKAKKKWFLVEFLELFALNLKVNLKNFLEYFRVVSRYYHNRLFAKADLLLLKQYITCSPFRMSRQQLQTMGEEDVYSYGETPLTTLDLIVKTCGITDKDTFFEIGSGRGRSCFWLRLIVGCTVVGIEWLTPFVLKAKSVAQSLDLDRITFLEEDFLQSSFKEATVIYLYGTCMSDDQITKLCDSLKNLSKGVHVISVSYPLTDYSSEFEVLRSFSAPFTWGDADIYLQVKN